MAHDVQATIDASTGLGTADIWFNRADCTKPATAPTSDDVAIQVAEQENDYDLDQDGCTNAEELWDQGANPEQYGGLRDPYNKKDHTDVNKDGLVTVADVNAVLAKFGVVPPGTQEDIRPSMTGSNPWNHRNADLVVNISHDLFGTSAQIGHDCDGKPGP